MTGPGTNRNSRRPPFAGTKFYDFLALMARFRLIWLVVCIVAVLLLLRQCYLGGRIPLLREPEHFRVDPDPREGFPH